MPKFKDVLPEDAKARIEAAADAEKRARGLWGETEKGVLRPIAAPMELVSSAQQIGAVECDGAAIPVTRLVYGVALADDSPEEARAAALDSLQNAIEQGEVVARGWRPDAPIDEPPTVAHPERWQTVAFDPAADVARDRATGAVVATGLRFERTAPKRAPAADTPRNPGGRPRKATVAEIEAVVESAGLKPAELGFSAFCRELKALGVAPAARALEEYWRRFPAQALPADTLGKIRRQVFSG